MPGTEFEKDGWWGGVLIQFNPDVAGAEANEILRDACRAIERKYRKRVVKALAQGPTHEGNRG